MIGIEQASLSDAERMAIVHARCFDRSWKEAEFTSLLSLPGSVGFVARQDGETVGMALIRCAADEAELLTIGVDPACRQAGCGRALLERVEAMAAYRNGRRIFLEVSIGNAAAIALYNRAGYLEIARRTAYYRDGSDAVVMEKTLLPHGQAAG